MAEETKAKKKMVTLTAKTRIKHGGEGYMDPKVGFVRTAEAQTVEPGEEFEIDPDAAEDLILAGAAASPSDYAAEQKASKTNEEKAAEMRRALGESDLEAAAKAGDSVAIMGNAHKAAQKREEDTIAEAQSKEKGGAKKPKGDKD